MEEDAAIKLHPCQSFECKPGKFKHLPNPPLRFGFVGVSGSGKGVCMLDLLLRHYRGFFERIFLYSPSATLDMGWDSLRKYVRSELHVDSDKEQWCFDEFDSQALQQQLDARMKVAELAKKMKLKRIPQVPWIFGVFADDAKICIIITIHWHLLPSDPGILEGTCLWPLKIFEHWPTSFV